MNRNNMMSVDAAISGSGNVDRVLRKPKGKLGERTVAAIQSCFRKMLCKSKDHQDDSTYVPEKSLIDRKVEQLKHQERKYLVSSTQPLNKSNLTIQSSTEMLSPDSAGILQYMSKGDQRNFNCKVSSAVDHELIVCCHLAYAFATDEFGTRGHKKFESIDTLEKISQHTGIKTNQMLSDTTEVNKVPQTGYYFDQTGLGAALQVAVKQQKSDGHDSKTYLFESLSHTMALKMSWSGEPSEIKLAFYDPNDTLRVRRLIVPSFDALKTIKMEHLIPKERYVSLYFPESDVGGCLFSTESEKTPGSALINIVSDLNPSLVHLLLKKGHFGHKASIKNFQQVCKKAEPSDQQRLFEAASSKGVKGVYMAMQNGHEGCVKAYLDTVNLLPSDMKEAKRALLGAEDKDGVSALYMAMKNGHEGCVKAWLDAVNSLPSDMSEAKKTLLRARTREGFTALLAALFLGPVDCVKIYCQGILKSTLTDSEKQTLLATEFKGAKAKDYQNYLPAEVVTVYRRIIEESELGDDIKSDLLG